MRDFIENLRKEAETTLRVFYSLRQFSEMLTSEKDVELMNENADFWVIYESALRSKLFIGIRRLYESKSGTFNFQKFIDKCIESTHSFDKDALRKRKCDSSANAEEWIEDYMRDAYVPNSKDFMALAKLVRENSKNMKGVYTQAASKIYAHAIHMNHASMAEISNKLNYEEIEKALISIWHAYEQVWQMHENGIKPSLSITGYPYSHEVIQAVTKQVRRK